MGHQNNRLLLAIQRDQVIHIIGKKRRYYNGEKRIQTKSSCQWKFRAKANGQSRQSLGLNKCIGDQTSGRHLF